MSAPLPYVYAALLDVLGYRDRLLSDRQAGTLAFKDALQTALQVLGSVNETEVAYQAISDTVILTCPQREKFLEFLLILKNVQISFLRQQLFVRGGVTYAQHFKSTHVTYSHAIAGAYEIESKVALYPRIVVDHNILEMLKTAAELQPIIDAQIVCTCNGVHFVNIIDSANWPEIYTCARDLFLRDQPNLTRKEPEFAKHFWFERYLFSSPHKTPDVARYTSDITLLS